MNKILLLSLGLASIFTAAASAQDRTPSRLPGDVNGDGNVNIADVVTIDNYLRGLDPKSMNAVNADVDGDNIISEADRQIIIEIILHRTTVDDARGNVAGADSEGECAGIEDVASRNVEVRALSDGVEILNADGNPIEVYGLAGECVAAKAKASDYERIHLNGGVYVVKVGQKSVKIIVK